MEQLAPIAVSTYNRLEHLKKTINALRKNTLAKESELYILSDAPKLGDEDNVYKVREYIHTVDGFKKVYIVKRETNSRVENNRGGIQQLLNKYGKCIFLEDDIVTSPGFLEFINRGLNKYKNRDDIFSICGYTPSLQLQSISCKDIYLSTRFSAWGFGIWNDRYESIVMKLPEYESIRKNSNLIKKIRASGEDLLNMIKRESLGEIDALDVKIFYTQHLRDLYCIAPTQSLTSNIGHDGTGIHCGVTDRFNVILSEQAEKVDMDTEILLDKRILKKLYYFRSGLPENIVKRMFILSAMFIKKSYSRLHT